MIHPALLSLIQRCETICMTECCGRAAFDFSPIHIASALLMLQGQVNEDDLTAIRQQLTEWETRHGTRSVGRKGVTIVEMNQIFSAAEIDDLAKEISQNLDIALEIIQFVNARTISTSGEISGANSAKNQ